MNNYNKNIFSLFFRKEIKVLLGKNYINFWLLVFVFFVAILSIGFASAGLKYLSYKMEDPFINWVDIIARQQTEIVAKADIKVEAYLDNTFYQTKYGFGKPHRDYTLSEYFRKNNAERDIQFEGRSIDSESNIIDAILNGENIIVKREIPVNSKEFGLIVTKELLERLDYDRDEMPCFINLSKPYDIPTCENMGLGRGYNGYYPVAIPVIAVVKQLPGLYDFIFTTRYYHEANRNIGNSFDITDEGLHTKLLICIEPSESEGLADYIKKNTEYECSVSDYHKSWKQLSLLTISAFDRAITLAEACALEKVLRKENFDFTRIYEFGMEPEIDNLRVDLYSIEMVSLDSIRSFQKDLYETTGIKLDMTNILAKENFLFVQRMGNVLSLCIICLSILFIATLISYLFNNHFQKIQENLGTFKAFGITNRTLHLVYITILLTLILSTFLVAAVCVLLLAQAAYFCGLYIEFDFPYFNIITWQNGLLLVASIVMALCTTAYVVKKKLSNTPGDLIYNRI